MRRYDPENKAHKSFWLNRFLRIVLTRCPTERFKLSHTTINILYDGQPDPVIAARQYLKGIEYRDLSEMLRSNDV